MRRDDERKFQKKVLVQLIIEGWVRFGEQDVGIGGRTWYDWISYLLPPNHLSQLSVVYNRDVSFSIRGLGTQAELGSGSFAMWRLLNLPTQLSLAARPGLTQ
jgi:hypothetical protein